MDRPIVSVAPFSFLNICSSFMVLGKNYFRSWQCTLIERAHGKGLIILKLHWTFHGLFMTYVHQEDISISLKDNYSACYAIYRNYGIFVWDKGGGGTNCFFKSVQDLLWILWQYWYFPSWAWYLLLPLIARRPTIPQVLHFLGFLPLKLLPRNRFSQTNSSQSSGSKLYYVALYFPLLNFRNLYR